MFDQKSSAHSTQHVNAEQYLEHQRGHELIARNIADLMVAGEDLQADSIQYWIGKHYEFVCKFWTPNRIAYKALALNYTLDPAFMATYESFEPGLALYIQKAINYWADRNLN